MRGGTAKPRAIWPSELGLALLALVGLYGEAPYLRLGTIMGQGTGDSLRRIMAHWHCWSSLVNPDTCVWAPDGSSMSRLAC